MTENVISHIKKKIYIYNIVHIRYYFFKLKLFIDVKMYFSSYLKFFIVDKINFYLFISS